MNPLPKSGISTELGLLGGHADCTVQATEAARSARWQAVLACGVAALTAGCETAPKEKPRAPVEDRSGARPAVVVVPAGPSPVPAFLPPPASPLPAAEPAVVRPVLAGAENAGKPGYYTVKPGDTLIRIALDQGQNWRDVQRWSGLDNPNLIEVGQVLRVAPPGLDPGAAQARPVVVANTRPEGRPLERPSGPTAGTPASPSAAATGAAPPSASTAAGSVPASSPVQPNATGATSAPSGAAAPVASPASEEEPVWAWPAAGGVVVPFEEGKSKGVLIAGKAGDPVLAAADGRVVYAGSGLRGYGNLIIVKHNNTFLTAYAHNQALLVREDQVVRRGQRIAEMGATDADRVALHFEVRRLGKPQDPAKFLPGR